MTTIYDAIKADHDQHRKLLDTIEDTSGDTTKRRVAWTTFYEDVKAHAAAEEETFYSKLISKTWGQDHARHSVHEHQKLDDLMEELNDMDMGHGSWLQKFKTLRHDYEHHIEEEEDEVFARAQEIIPDDALAGYAERFTERKSQEARLIEEKKADTLED